MALNDTVVFRRVGFATLFSWRGMKRKFRLTGVLIVLLLLCTPLPVLAPDALTMMHTVFKGDYTKAQIKQQLDVAMKFYNTPITEENYSRAGSVLVTFRKDTGIHEMVILDYMIRSYVPGVKLNFPDAAAIAATFMQLGDR